MKYYTLQIRYQNGVNTVTHELKDLHNKDPKISFNDWVSDIRKRLYTTGFSIQAAPTTWELINPFKIHTVIIIEQPHKYTT